MSTAYTLEIETRLTPRDLIAVIASQPGFRDADAGSADAPTQGRVALGHGLLVVAGPADEDEIELTLGTAGFRPTCSVLFVDMRRRDVPEDVRYTAMVGAVVTLLATVTGDAAMDFDCSLLLFIRRDGRVTVNTDWDEAQWPGDSPCRGLLRRSMASATLAALAPL